MEDVELLRSRVFRVVRRSDSIDGRPLPPRDVIEHPGAVAVLPVLDDGRICLIRNYRIAVGRRLVEVPAGTLEPNEPPLATAYRELTEETGYEAGHMEPLAQMLMSPGILHERMHVFAATELTPGDPHREPGEEIDNLLVSLDEALAMIERGEIEDAKTIATLLLYDRRRPK